MDLIEGLLSPFADVTTAGGGRQLAVAWQKLASSLLIRRWPSMLQGTSRLFLPELPPGPRIASCKRESHHSVCDQAVSFASPRAPSNRASLYLFDHLPAVPKSTFLLSCDGHPHPRTSAAPFDPLQFTSESAFRR